MIKKLTTEEITKRFAEIDKSREDNGLLDLIVVRPTENERKILPAVEVTTEYGLMGDNWKERASKHKEINYKTQITLINSKFIELISGPRENWIQSGDQLFVDLDISEENLPAGQQLTIGSADNVILEITEIPHTGCSKFASRYGNDALRFISAREKRSLRLRGVYARVIKPGTIKQNDLIRKISS